MLRWKNEKEREKPIRQWKFYSTKKKQKEREIQEWTKWWKLFNIFPCFCEKISNLYVSFVGHRTHILFYDINKNRYQFMWTIFYIFYLFFSEICSIQCQVTHFFYHFIFGLFLCRIHLYLTKRAENIKWFSSVYFWKKMKTHSNENIRIYIYILRCFLSLNNEFVDFFLSKLN